MATTTNNSKEVLQSQEQGVSSSMVVENNDEFLKKNTDCVYFLASPLTCKKGSECEYRHSEYARVNPRDCWYWLNGNCLNPKCSFRHPPLEGLVGPQTGNFTGPPTLAPTAPAVSLNPQNPTKQGVPCIFFQKGYCLKGDRCPFMHGPNPATTKVQPQIQANSQPLEAPPIKKATQPKVNLGVNVPKVVDPPTQAKVVSKAPSTRPINVQSPSVVLEEAPNYEETKRSSAINGNSKGRTGPTYRGGLSEDLNFQNGRDADDSLRESSPGFDVLVDDKLSDDEYYHNEDQFPRMKGHEKRNLNEFDLGHHDEYNPVSNVDQEMYHNRRGYDSFDRVQEKYGWDHRRRSSERSLVEPSHYDRRGSYNKSQSPDLNQSSDLRQRLSSKQRRVNELKSVVNPEYNVDEDRGYRSSSRRDPRRSPVHETSRGHRLQGRIKLPRRSSPINGNEMYSERENERARNWGRLSPTRKHVSGQQSRLQNRLSGRILEETREGRRINDPIMRKDTFQTDGSDFAGPKSLSELKSTKQPVSGGKLRDTILASSIGNDRDVSFEGPKPLSEILKRKRPSPTNNTNAKNKEEMKHHESDVVKQATPSPEVENNKPQAFEADEEEGEVSNKKMRLIDEGESSLPNNEDDNKNPEIGEGEIDVNNEEHEFDEGYDQGDGEYEYEQEDGEGYDLNEVENGEHEIDSMDEDDGDDFAKTLGVSF